ncbi:MAG: FHA domain-containing protein, partial [Deltaproteobacteria bacterium]|nr:FHA domain-containing protein [Deltaproteobacteria bacterium]
MAFIIRKRIGDRSDDSEVSGPLLQIGRAGTANLLLDDDGVALEHARINQEDGRYVLTAQDSITGTYVNGKRVQAVILSDGDRVTIGPFLLEVHIPGPGEPLSLDISPVAAAAQPERSRVEAEKIDYAAAYTLSRKFLFKTFLFLLLVGALLGSLLWHGKTNFFRPGSVSDAHALFTNQCARCH